MASSIIGNRRPNVLIAGTGSVATLKIPELAVRISTFANVRIVLTSASKYFWERASEYDPTAMTDFKALDPSLTIYTDETEWSAWNVIGDPVIHIELREWADLLLIAPLSANTLGKIACGLCDNLLTSIVRAWDVAKPVIVAPAMNTHMWDHPFTNKHLSILEKDLSYIVIPPIAKLLACGDMGTGALAAASDIEETVRKLLKIDGAKEASIR